MKVKIPKGEALYRVDFSDGGSEDVTGEDTLHAAKRAARRYKAKQKRVRVLRARRQR